MKRRQWDPTPRAVEELLERAFVDDVLERARIPWDIRRMFEDRLWAMCSLGTLADHHGCSEAEVEDVFQGILDCLRGLQTDAAFVPRWPARPPDRRD
jgi:hypothetical protein